MHHRQKLTDDNYAQKNLGARLPYQSEQATVQVIHWPLQQLSDGMMAL